MSAGYEFARLPTPAQIALNASNFTDSKQRTPFQFPNATYSSYNPGWQILLSIRGTFCGEAAG